MIIKVVCGEQIRLLESKDKLTLTVLKHFVEGAFPTMKSYYFYYIDQEGDEIVMETDEDMEMFLGEAKKIPKVGVREVVD